MNIHVRKQLIDGVMIGRFQCMGMVRSCVL